MPNPKDVQLAGAQHLVRTDMFRARFCNSFEKPKPFRLNVPIQVKYSLSEAKLALY